MTRRKDISMTDEAAMEFLREERQAVLATIGLDGLPHMTTVSYVFDDGKLIANSYRRSQKVANLRRVPGASMLIELGRGPYSQIQGVLAFGTVTLHDDPEWVIRLEEQMMARAPHASPHIDLPRIAPKRTVIEFVPSRLVSWDHRKLDNAF